MLHTLLRFHEHRQADAQRKLQARESRLWLRREFLQVNPVGELLGGVRFAPQRQAYDLFLLRTDGHDRRGDEQLLGRGVHIAAVALRPCDCLNLYRSRLIGLIADGDGRGLLVGREFDGHRVDPDVCSLYRRQRK